MPDFGDERSTRFVFLSHCILAQGIRATGLAKYHAAIVKPVLQFLMDNDINIAQMPCPESRCAAGGIGREPHGKVWYEKHGLRETSETIAQGQAMYMKSLVDNGFEILAVIGMEFSPACAVTYLNRGPVVVKDKGIYIEELMSELERLELDIPFIGINQRWHKKLDRDLQRLVA